jgi:hypothetical protein
MPISKVSEAGLSSGAQFNGFKNRIINGAMVIDQRNAGAAVTVTGSFPVDRFIIANGTDGAFSAQQDSSAPSGFVNSVKVTTTTADGTLTAGQNLNFQQRIEGTNVADLGWGTANAKTVTLSFWVRSSLTGTFGGALTNSDANRCYPFAYTISVADTWEYKTVTIPGDTSGTWLTTTGSGIRVFFTLGAGPDRSGTADAWTGSTILSPTGSVSVIGTLSATWYVTGVQLEKGSTATSFDYRPYGTELALCQRYAIVYGRDQVYNEIGGTGSAYSTTKLNAPVSMPVQMRSTPTISNSGALQASDGASATALTVINIITQQSSSLIASLEGTTASGLTAFRPYRIETNNSTTAYVLLSAEDPANTDYQAYLAWLAGQHTGTG